MDPWVLWIGLGCLVLLGVCVPVVRLVQSKSNWDKIATTVGLPLIDQVRPKLRREQRGGLWAIPASVAVGLGVSVGLLVAIHATQLFEMAYGYFLILSVAVGLGSIVAILLNERNRQRADVRVARSRAVTRTDYETRLWQWTPRMTVGLFLVGLLARTLITSDPRRDIPVFLVIYAVVTVATLAFSELACNWIVGRGQTAGSNLELAWDDALKARSMMSLVYAPAILGAFGSQVGTALTLPAIHATVGRVFDTVHFAPNHETIRFTLGLLAQDLFGIAAILVWMIAMLVGVAQKSQQQYLRMLWPDLVPPTSTPGVDTVPAPKGA